MLNFVQSLKENCGGEYHDIDPTNAACLNDVEAYDNVNKTFFVFFFLGGGVCNILN